MSRPRTKLNTLPEDEEEVQCIDTGLASRKVGGSSTETTSASRDSSRASTKPTAQRSRQKSSFLKSLKNVTLDDSILNLKNSPKKKQGLHRMSSLQQSQKHAKFAAAVAQQPRQAQFRRKEIGDSVLVRYHGRTPRRAVNEYGFPAGEGATPEEQNGPYLYVLAKVKKVHFGENAEYYTVTRADTGHDQRADRGELFSISGHGKAAASIAANQAQTNQSSIRSEDPSPNNRTETKCLTIFEAIICLPLTPFLWLAECFVIVIGRRLYQLGAKALASTRSHGGLFLNGSSPYACSIRITLVNILVICSIWYVFIDQARLAFFPPSSDHAVAIVSL